jgi:REP element-mobilizing transposase RayT
VCEHHLLSCRKGIIADPSRQEKTAYTYKLINRRGSHTIWDCKYHLIWVTKYHYPILVGDVSQRARELLREIARTNEMTIYGGAINRDHVHILISIPPQLSVSRAVQFLKGKSRTKMLGAPRRVRVATDAEARAIGLHRRGLCDDKHGASLRPPSHQPNAPIILPMTVKFLPNRRHARTRASCLRLYRLISVRSGYS